MPVQTPTRLGLSAFHNTCQGNPSSLLVLSCLLPNTFLTKVSFSGENYCWIWNGPKVFNPRYKDRREGWEYGQFTWKVRRPEGGWVTKGVAAHKFCWERVIGHLAPGMELDHLCENKLCINPAHLEPVTHSENMRRYFLRKEARAC